MKIPFWLQPYSWILKGEEYDIAKIKYELSGFERDMALLNLMKDKYTSPNEYKIKEINIKLEHKKITGADWYEEMAQFETGTAKEKFMLSAKLERKEINDEEYRKELANIDNEPYIKVINSSYNKAEGLNGFVLELDWNKAFIEYLLQNGYSGKTEKDIVDTWFQDIVREQDEDEDNPENFIQVSPPRTIRTPDGKIERR